MLCERVCGVAALADCSLLSQGGEVQELAVSVVSTRGRPTAKTRDANDIIFIKEPERIHGRNPQPRSLCARVLYDLSYVMPSLGGAEAVHKAAWPASEKQLFARF